MNPDNIRHLRPFISLVLIIGSLLLLVFLRMEEIRLGYSVLKTNAEFKKVVDQKRLLEIQLAKVTRPQLLDAVAQRKLTLRKVASSQIIHLSGEGTSFYQKPQVALSAKKEF